MSVKYTLPILRPQKWMIGVNGYDIADDESLDAVTFRCQDCGKILPTIKNTYKIRQETMRQHNQICPNK